MNTTSSNSNPFAGTATTTGNIIWNETPAPMTYTQLFARRLKEDSLLKEGFKAMFSVYIRKEFAEQIKSGQEITNEDFRKVADKAAENFTEYLCNL